MRFFSVRRKAVVTLIYLAYVNQGFFRKRRNSPLDILIRRKKHTGRPAKLPFADLFNVIHLRRLTFRVLTILSSVNWNLMLLFLLHLDGIGEFLSIIFFSLINKEFIN